MDVSAPEIELVRRAIARAAQARAEGCHPFGSLVAAADGAILAERGNNGRPPHGDPTQHAELSAAAAAFRVRPDGLATATLFTSAEPCAMCAGAIYWTGIGRVVYALSETRLRSITGAHPENPTLDLPCRDVFARGQRTVEVVGPVLEDEAVVVHEGFWA